VSGRVVGDDDGSCVPPIDVVAPLLSVESAEYDDTARIVGVRSEPPTRAGRGTCLEATRTHNIVLSDKLLVYHLILESASGSTDRRNARPLRLLDVEHVRIVVIFSSPLVPLL